MLHLAASLLWEPTSSGYTNLEPVRRRLDGEWRKRMTARHSYTARGGLTSAHGQP